MKVGILTTNATFLGPVLDALRKHGHEYAYWTQTGTQFMDYMNVTRIMDWCDVAFFDWAQTPFLEGMSIEKRRCKVAVRPHGMEFFSIYKEFPWNTVDLVIGPADIIGQALETLPPQNRPPKYVHAPVGSDPTFFTIPKSKRYGKRIILHSTTIRYRKRVYTTLQSFYDLVQHDEKWKLHIVGEWESGYGPGWEGEQYTGPCRELMEDLEIRTKIAMTPNMPKEQWRTYLADKDIFISNGIREGVHVSLVDAMLCGVFPLINCWRGSDQYYPKENIFKTQRELVDKILEWSVLPLKEKKRLSQEARAWAVERFDDSVSAERIVEELEML